MNKKDISWNEWEKEFQEKWAKEDLKKSKSGGIAFLESQGRKFREEQFHAYWEDYLSSADYWKNWQEKINSFQTMKEVDFYTDRLRAFMDFVEKYTRKDINRYSGRVIEGAQQWDPVNTPKMIEQELDRLEHISEEEFNRTDEWRKNPVFKELSTEEMLNDPWFNNEINRLFGLENNQTPPQNCTFCSKAIDLQWVRVDGKYFCNSECMFNRKSKKDDDNADYQNWTCEQLISEINRLKVENEQLKNNQTLTSPERQARLRENQQKLEKLTFCYNVNSQPNNSKNNFLISWVIGGIILLAVGGLTALLVIRNKRKKNQIKI